MTSSDRAASGSNSILSRVGGLPDRHVRWLLMLPLLLLVFMSIYPTLNALYMSLHQWEGAIQDRPFIGLENYDRLLDLVTMAELVTFLLADEFPVRD